jgi:hypothetical protein
MAGVVFLAAAQGVSAANAQTSNLCMRLEARLVQIERGARSAGNNSQRYDAPIAQQQGEIDRATAEARRAGCIGGFLIFKPRPDPKCGALMTTINRMQGNLQRLLATRDRAGGDPYSIARERGEILRQLAFNRCGPNYASNQQRGFGAPRPGGLLGAIFGGPQIRSFDDESFMPETQVGTYRTLCVRSCDGYYFPISFSTVPSRFNNDAATCQAMCPGAQAELFTYRNPGEDTAQAVSLAGEPYTSLPNAFRYRKEYDKSCTCHSAVANPVFTDFTDPVAIENPALAPVRVAVVPMPRLRPPEGEDPETAANRAGRFVPAPITEPSSDVQTSDADSGRKVRVVGPAFFYGQ